MSEYKITVVRNDVSVCNGTLKFFIDGNLDQETECWENPENLIPAKTYTGCSTTIMADKGYESVFLPNEQTGKVGIFIHRGGNPGDSDGCIVCSSSVVSRIYSVVPHNSHNVTVEVS